MGSGNRRLYEIADSSRGLLLTSLRGLGVLASHTDREESNGLDLKGIRGLDAASIEGIWLEWVDKERKKRIAWSAFEYDCTLSTLTSKRGAFNIAELPARLPCMESFWEAHSAQSWASLVSFSTSPPVGLPFYATVRDIIAKKSTLSTVPPWSRRLCAQAIGRMLWDLKEIEHASSPHVLGLTSLATTHQESKAALLSSLTDLHDSQSNPTCTADIVNMK